MAHIDFKDNLFHGFCAYDDRGIFRDATGKNQGFKWSRERHAWVTPDADIAMAVKGVVWTLRAQSEVDRLLEVARISEEMSWKADTEFMPPAPPGLEYLPYQRAGIEYALMRKDTLIADQPGLGKMQPMDAPVLTPEGWVAIGDLKVGDDVMHPYHGRQKVVGVYDRGVMPMYRVTFSDGSSTICGGDHLWTFRRPRYISRVNRREVWPTWETRELEDIIERFSGYKSLRSAKLRIPQVKPLEFDKQTHIIHPYILGVILGDGSITQHTIYVTSADDDMKGEITALLPPEMKYVDRRTNHDPYAFVITSVVPGQNTYVEALRKLDLMGCDSSTKFIPDEYLVDSVDNRRALLQGLLDTDGYCGKDGTLQFSSNSEKLADGVRHLVWSLGGVARKTKKISASGHDHWIITINLPEDEIPFRLIRKAIRYGRSAKKYHPCRFFTSIERIDDLFGRCIKVERPDGLYITDDFIVTHNTIQAIGVLNADEEVRSALFVVPASLKVNWYREIDKWMVADLSFGIAEARREERVQVGVFKTGKRAGQPRYKTVEVQKDYWPDTDVVIINYDILERFDTKIKDRTWDLLVCDECHALKSPQSGRTLFVLGGKKDPTKAERAAARAAKLPWPKPIWFTAIDANRRVFLSGTPMMSRPIELWPIANAFDPNGIGRDYLDYAYRYCAGWHDPMRGKNGALDASGASNLEELGEKARAHFMVRRLKREVLPELPPKRRIVVPMDSPEIRELVAREDELAQALKLYEKVTLGKGVTFDEAEHGTQLVMNAAKIGFDPDLDPDAPNWRTLDLDYAAAVAGLEPPAVQILFEEMATVRRELGLAKLSCITPWVTDFLEGGEKLLLFAYHSDVVKALAERLDNWNPAVIWGGTPLHKRQLQVDKFQDDDHCRLFIGNIQAAGVGFTLTRAADVAFAEGDWVPSQIEQCEDRACRIGQTAEKINSYFLVANGSLDARIAQAAKMKEDNINLAMGA